MLYTYDTDKEIGRAKSWLFNLQFVIAIIGISIFLIVNSHPLALSFKENLRLIGYNFNIIWWEVNNPSDIYYSDDAYFDKFRSGEDYYSAANLAERNRQREKDKDVIQIILKLINAKSGTYPKAAEVVKLDNKNNIYKEMKKYNYAVPVDPNPFLSYGYISSGEIYLLSTDYEAGREGQGMSIKYYSNNKKIEDDANSRSSNGQNF
jgi:hypothetical protein